MRKAIHRIIVAASIIAIGYLGLTTAKAGDSTSISIPNIGFVVSGTLPVGTMQATSLSASTGSITSLSGSSIQTSNLSANAGSIASLTGTTIQTSNLSANAGVIESLSGTRGVFTNGVNQADYAPNAGLSTEANSLNPSATIQGSQVSGQVASAYQAAKATDANYASSANTANSATSAASASYADTAGSANTANSATTAASASYAATAGSATSALNATYATTAGSATTATSAMNASYASSAGTAGTATTASAVWNPNTGSYENLSNVTALYAEYAGTTGAFTSAQAVADYFNTITNASTYKFASVTASDVASDAVSSSNPYGIAIDGAAVEEQTINGTTIYTVGGLVQEDPYQYSCPTAYAIPGTNTGITQGASGCDGGGG